VNRALRFTLLGLAVVVVLFAVSCGGGGDSLEPLTTSEAQDQIRLDMDYNVSCIQVAAPETHKDFIEQQWRCKGGGKEACFLTYRNQGGSIASNSISERPSSCPGRYLAP
jgi:hypothetical protein